jgi:methionine salvage enolase-phosphatase E1
MSNNSAQKYGTKCMKVILKGQSNGQLYLQNEIKSDIVCKTISFLFQMKHLHVYIYHSYSITIARKVQFCLQD